MLRLLLGSAIFIFSCNLLNANIDSIVLNRIENFTKVYSLVKFYYPSDELVKFNWDKYSEYMISYALSAKSDSLFYQKLEYTLELIAPGVQVSHDLAEFKFQKLIPLDSNMFPKVTFLQSRYSLNRILESNYGSINYRYDRPDYKRKYIESRPSSKVQGKKIRLIIKGNIKGQSKGEKNFILSQRYKYLNIDTTEDVSISINSSIDSTYLCELIIKENSYAFALIMYYPKENYILNVTDFKYEAFINEKWVNIDSVVVQRKERYPTVFFRHDYFMDSALIDSVNKFTTKSIFFDKIYDVSDTPISINVNGLTFFIPLKLRTSSNNTYPIVDSMKFANFNREIDIWNADDLVKDFNILSKIYGYLFLDYPYADRVFFNLLSDRFKLSLINRELFPSRSIDIWLENELLYFLGDPHMDIKKTNKHFLTSKFYGTTVIDNKCVINYTLDTSKLKLGDEIVEINCKPVHTYLGGLNKKTSLIQKTRFFENLLIELHNDTNQETYDLKIIRQNKPKKIMLKPLHKPNYILKYPPQNYFEKVNDSIVLYNPRAILHKQFSGDDLTSNEYIDTIANYPYVIYMLNNLDNDISRLLNFLEGDFNSKKHKSYHLFKSSNIPFNHFTYDTIAQTNIISKKKSKVKKLFIYIDRYVQSSREFRLLPYLNHPDVVLIGENTAGAFGSVNKVQLNSEIQFEYTSNKFGFYKNDKFVTYQNAGIPPNVPFNLPIKLTPSIELTNKVIEIVKNNFK